MQRLYSEWEITGAPEVRRVTETSVQPFNPFEPPLPPSAIIAPMLLWTDDGPFARSWWLRTLDDRRSRDYA
jgi:hypothetical protein